MSEPEKVRVRFYDDRSGKYMGTHDLPMAAKDGAVAAADALDAAGCRGFTWLPAVTADTPAWLLAHGRLRTR